MSCIENNSFKALLTDRYFGLLQAAQEKVPASVLMSAVSVGAFLHAACKSESDMLVGMMAVLRLEMKSQADLSPAFTCEDYELRMIQSVVDIWKHPKDWSEDDSLTQSQWQAITDIAAAIGVVKLRRISYHGLRMSEDPDVSSISEFLDRCHWVKETTEETVFYVQFDDEIDKLANLYRLDTPWMRLNQTVFYIWSKNEKPVPNIVHSLAWEMGFEFHAQYCSANLQDMQSLRVTAQSWETGFLQKFVWGLQAHFPELEVRGEFMSKEMLLLTWRKRHLTISDKIAIYRSNDMRRALRTKTPYRAVEHALAVINNFWRSD